MLPIRSASLHDLMGLFEDTGCALIRGHVSMPINLTNVPFDERATRRVQSSLVLLVDASFRLEKRLSGSVSGYVYVMLNMRGSRQN
jgi:hypothetical protein